MERFAILLHDPWYFSSPLFTTSEREAPKYVSVFKYHSFMNKTGTRKKSKKGQKRENKEQKRKQKRIGGAEKMQIKKNQKRNENIQNREKRKENRQRHN